MRNAYLGFIIFCCIACQKKADDNNNTNTNLIPVTIGRVRVLIGVPDFPTANISYNSILFNSNISYPTASGYANIGIGVVPVSITNSANGLSLYSFNANIAESKFHTLVLCDSASRIKPTFLNDVQLTIPTGNAAVRFLHISDLAGGVNFLVSGAATNISAARNFNDHQANASTATYSLQPTGNVNFEVRKPGVSGAAGSVATLRVDLIAGRYYTFLLVNKARVTTPGSGVLTVVEDL